MSIDTAIYQLLTTGGIERVYPPPVPDNPVYPLVTYEEVSDPEGYHLRGADGFVFARFQFNCWDRTQSGARAVKEQLRDILSGFKGTSDGVDIQSAFNLGGPKDYFADVQAHRFIQDYRITYKRDVIPMTSPP